MRQPWINKVLFFFFFFFIWFQFLIVILSSTHTLLFEKNGHTDREESENEKRTNGRGRLAVSYQSPARSLPILPLILLNRTVMTVE